MKTKKFCRYCGGPYPEDLSWLHGHKHLVLTTPRYDEETGKSLEKSPYWNSEKERFEYR